MISTVKNVVTRLAGASALQPVVGFIEHVNRRQASLLRVLTYHRIGYPERTTWDRGLFSATPQMFRDQLEMLLREYKVVSLADVFSALEMGERLPPRAVLITFDDAYRDFLELAFPALQERQIPATLFVPTAFPSNSQQAFWWDRLCHAVRSATITAPVVGRWGRIALTNDREKEQSLRVVKKALKSLPHREAMSCVDEICQQLKPASSIAGDVLTWPELNDLAANGVSIGLHTQNHPLLNRVTSQELNEEIVDAWEDLCSHIADAQPAFAYPAGGVSQEARRLLRTIGMRAAFTTQSGSNELGVTDPLLLRRIHVGQTTTCNVLRAKLAASLTKSFSSAG